MEKLEINGKLYSRMDDERYGKCYDGLDICSKLKNGEYAPYYSRIVFKINNRCFVVERDDLSNYIEV